MAGPFEFVLLHCVRRGCRERAKRVDGGASPSWTTTSPPPNGGDLRHPRLRHADDIPPEGFAWRKTPAVTPGVRFPH